MSFKLVDHVLFDMDGLLIDSEVYFTQSLKNAASKYGKNVDWELEKKVMGTGGIASSRVIVRELDLPINPQQFLDQMEEQFPILFPNCELMPGVERLLNHLNKHKIPIAIASGSPAKFFNMKISHLMNGFFKSHIHHVLLARDDPEVVNGKPAPDTFLICKKRFNEPDLTSDRCLVFEDSIPGVLAAIRAGMQVVHVPDPRLDVAGYMESNAELRPTLILKSIEDFIPEQFGLPPYDQE